MTSTNEFKRRTARALLVGVAMALPGCSVGPFWIAPPVTAQSPAASFDPGPLPTPGPMIPSAPTGRAVYLASIGPFPTELIAELATVIEGRHDLDVQVLAPSTLEARAFDADRDQYVSEDLIEGLIRAYPKQPTEDGSVVIGLLAEDVHIRSREDWSWAFGMRHKAGYAVVSTARMGSLSEPVDPIVVSRLRKMVLRNIGVLYYGLPLNDDPLSVLYADVLSVDDLDRMGELLCGSSCPGIAWGPAWPPGS